MNLLFLKFLHFGPLHHLIGFRYFVNIWYFEQNKRKNSIVSFLAKEIKGWIIPKMMTPRQGMEAPRHLPWGTQISLCLPSVTLTSTVSLKLFLSLLLPESSCLPSSLCSPKHPSYIRCLLHCSQSLQSYIWFTTASVLKSILLSLTCKTSQSQDLMFLLNHDGTQPWISE